MRSRRGHAIRFFAVLLGVALALAIIEVSLRVVGWGFLHSSQNDSLLGYSNAPFVEGFQGQEGRAYVRFNNAGMRDDRSVGFTKAEDEYRIVILGDSFMEARQVSFRESFCWLLEKNLQRDHPEISKRIRILNFGCYGYGTAQEYLLLENRVWAYDPDMVLLAFFNGNDVRDNHPDLRGFDYVPFVKFDEAGNPVTDCGFLQSARYLSRASLASQVAIAFVRHSRVLQYFRLIYHRIRAALTEADLAATIEDGHEIVSRLPSWSEAWNWTEKLLLLMNRSCHMRSVPFGVFVIGGGASERGLQSTSKTTMFDMESRLARLFTEEEIPYFLLGSAMSKIEQRKGICFHGFPNGGGHWNERGHSVASALVTNWVSDTFSQQFDGAVFGSVD